MSDRDSLYTSIETQLSCFAAQRDALVAQILLLLESAELNGTQILDNAAQNLIQQSQDLLSNAEAYAGSL